MLDLQNTSVSGITCRNGIVWVAIPEEHLVAVYDPIAATSEKKLTYSHAVWDVCPGEEGIWMMTDGGKLGRQIVLWSQEEEREIRRFTCPDGAGAGFTLCEGKLWVTHRHNRKLICLDPRDGKARWVIRTEHETFSPSAFGSDLWFVEAEPGPLGHWGQTGQTKHFFSRYDPARERVVERLPVAFVPTCMAFDGERFWYAEQQQRGLSWKTKE